MAKGIDTIPSTLSPKNLEEIIRVYHIDPLFRPRLPKNGETMLTPPSGFVGVYNIFMRAGLRFPAFPFLRVILSHYRLRLGQITPNSFRKIMCFILLHRALGLKLSLTIFRYFYVLKPNGDWVTISLRQGMDDMIGGLPSSVRCWKDEYFFVSSEVLGKELVPADDAACGTMDSPPFLSPEEATVAELLSQHWVKWIDPDEIILAMAGLSPKWESMGKRPTLSAGGQAVSLLDRLMRKEYPHPLSITEDPFLPEARKVLTGTSVTRSGDGLSVPVNFEVKSTVPDNFRLSGMKRSLESTSPITGSRTGGVDRSFSSSGDTEPIDVESVPDDGLVRTSYRVRRRMDSLLKKGVSSQPSSSSLSYSSPSGNVVKVISPFFFLVFLLVCLELLAHPLI